MPTPDDKTDPGPPGNLQLPEGASSRVAPCSVASVTRVPSPEAAQWLTGRVAAKWRAVRRRWLLAATLGLLLGSASGAALWFLRTPQYTAMALIRISPSQTHILPKGAANDASQEDKNYQKTQVALIKT